MDDEVGLRPADKVAEIWGDEEIFGWGRNVLAVNSARVGRRESAVGHLTAWDYWEFDDEGFADRAGGEFWLSFVLIFRWWWIDAVGRGLLTIGAFRRYAATIHSW